MTRIFVMSLKFRLTLTLKLHYLFGIIDGTYNCLPLYPLKYKSRHKMVAQFKSSSRAWMRIIIFEVRQSFGASFKGEMLSVHGLFRV